MNVVWTALKGLAVALVFSIIITAVTGYVATFSPLLSLVFGVVLMLQAVVTILWVIYRDLYFK